MNYSIAFLALVLFSTPVFLSCAGGNAPRVERAIAKPVPDRAGVSAWLAKSANDRPENPGFFIQMADTQLGMFASPLWLALFGATMYDDDFEVDARLFGTAIAHANELKPAFVVICGDLVNRAGHAGQIAEFQRIAAQLDRSIPLFLLAGNHDVENKPTAEALHAYRENFGPDWYSFRNGAVYGIVLNSQLIDAANYVPDEAERQLRWLRNELARAKESSAQHILVFQHQSYFLQSPDEKDQYFNVSLENRALYLDLFRQAGVEAVFAGHYHRNAVGRDDDLAMITTGPVGRPLGDDPSGFRIVEAGEGVLRHEYFSIEAP